MRRAIGLPLGPLLFVLILVIPPPEGVSGAAWSTAAVAALMAVWWITEAVPIPATSLLPLALFPLLGIASTSAAAAPYANPVIFLFLGGFLIAAALERSGLHRRIALNVIRIAGAKPSNLLFGFMVATGLLSAGVSNTATVALMLPMGISVIAIVQPGGETRAGFGPALMLGLTYAATLGGLATLIGTPPNALLAGYLSEAHGITIGFAEWMMVGVPLAAVSIPLCWALIVRLHHLPKSESTGSADLLRRELESLGPMSASEKLVSAITILVALAWIFRPLFGRLVGGLSDAGIAVIGALVLFAIPFAFRPMQFVLSSRELETIPWPVLLLFGGGLSLADSIDGSGLAAAIGRGVDFLRPLPILLVIACVTAAIVFLTELTSNTATAATFLPILGAAALGMGSDAVVLAVPTALAASCAFMLPVATPPNAIVYGSGRIDLEQMIRAGIWMNLLMITLIIATAALLVPLVFG